MVAILLCPSALSIQSNLIQSDSNVSFFLFSLFCFSSLLLFLLFSFFPSLSLSLLPSLSLSLSLFRCKHCCPPSLKPNPKSPGGEQPPPPTTGGKEVNRQKIPPKEKEKHPRPKRKKPKTKRTKHRQPRHARTLWWKKPMNCCCGCPRISWKTSTANNSTGKGGCRVSTNVLCRWVVTGLILG